MHEKEKLIRDKYREWLAEQPDIHEPWESHIARFTHWFIQQYASYVTLELAA
jgi:hypothetical protein